MSRHAGGRFLVQAECESSRRGKAIVVLRHQILVMALVARPQTNTPALRFSYRWIDV
ncbi:protein of unknown function [Paraburkholderia kururiensis]